MNDETRFSKLVDFIKENELGLMSSTSPETLAEMILSFIGIHNLAMMQRDKADGSYVEKRMDGIETSQKKDLETIDERNSERIK